ncbi:MAG: hypothetical protein V1710_00210 [Candidatus Bathyarchaeota archaeon]
MTETRNRDEIRIKAYSLTPRLLEWLKTETTRNYPRVSTSKVLGPDIEGSYWCFINIYREAE